MKKNEITIGGKYLAKVTDKVVTIRIDAENRHGGWDATNLETGKKIRIKNAQRLRGRAPDRPAADAEAQAADVTANVSAVDTDRVPFNDAVNRSSQAKAKKRSGLDLAYEMLKTSGQPMRCKDMVDKMLAEGLWKTDGRTPAATIYSAILREITTKGDQSRFRKTDRGLFAAA